MNDRSFAKGYCKRVTVLSRELVKNDDKASLERRRSCKRESMLENMKKHHRIRTSGQKKGMTLTFISPISIPWLPDWADITRCQDRACGCGVHIDNGSSS